MVWHVGQLRCCADYNVGRNIKSESGAKNGQRELALKIHALVIHTLSGMIERAAEKRLALEIEDAMNGQYSNVIVYP